MRTLSSLLVVMLLAAPAAVRAGEVGGLVVPPETGFWSRVQGRVSLGTGGATVPGDLPDPGANRVSGVSLVGDYYFSPPRSGAFRASGGLVVGGGLPWAATGGLASGGRVAVERQRGVDTLNGDQPTTMPYLGFGYMGLWDKDRFGFSADLGLVARNGPRVQLGRALSSPSSLDDTLREMRLTPVLRLGVSYAF